MATEIEVVTGALTEIQRRRSELVEVVERLELEHAHVTGALAVFRPLLRQVDRSLGRALTAHAAAIARQQAGREMPMMPAMPVLEAQVVDPARVCSLCPDRDPFPTVQGLRLHEQRSHPELVRERRQQLARAAAAESAYPTGRSPKQ